MGNLQGFQPEIAFSVVPNGLTELFSAVLHTQLELCVIPTKKTFVHHY